MPTWCCAVGCKGKGGHRFPSDTDLKRKWIVAIKREGFVPTDHSRVCKKHFLASDYDNSEFSRHTGSTGDRLQRHRLNETAVPSVFSWKKALKFRPAPKRNVPSKRRDAPPAPIVEVALDVAEETSGGDREEAIVLKSTCEAVTGDELDAIMYDVTSVEVCTDLQEGSNEPVVVGNLPKVEGKSSSNSHVKKFTSTASQTFSRVGMSYEWLKGNPSRTSYYTGLENYDKFMLVYHSLGPSVTELNYRYNVVECICPEDQFLLTLVKLRRDIPDCGLAMLFDVSRTTVQNIVNTWINFMYHEWKGINIWPSKELIVYYMPHGFRKMFPSTRVIVDGTEMPICAPKNPRKNQAAFSQYKNRTTVKTLVGASPGGLISYISRAYGGSISDRAIVERSDLVDKCDPSDSLMADRGFTVQDLFAPKHVAVNIPAFVKGKAQLNKKELLTARKLSSKRVYIERIIGLVKTYMILKHELNQYYTPIATEIFFVCCMLCNFRECIVNSSA